MRKGGEPSRLNSPPQPARLRPAAGAQVREERSNTQRSQQHEDPSHPHLRTSLRRARPYIARSERAMTRSQINLRIPPDEKQQLQAAAREHGFSMTTYLRALA